MQQANKSKKNPRFISFVFRCARQAETQDINNNRKGFFGRNMRPILGVISSLIVVTTLRTGFQPVFLELAATVLSIFIGLFITALVFAIDKFSNDSQTTVSEDYRMDISEQERSRNFEISIEEVHSRNSIDKIFTNQSINYMRQFNTLVGKNVLLCVFTLALVCLNLLYLDIFSTNPFNYHLIKPSSVEAIITFLGLTLLIILRASITYMFVSFFYDTVRIVSSLVNYMSADIDRR